MRTPGRVLLRCIAFPALSRLYGRLTRIRRPRGLARWMIRTFLNAHDVDMTRFQGTAEDYASLAAFFVRPLAPEARPKARPGRILSPADGCLTGMERVHGDAATQIKGLTYSLTELVGEKVDFASGWHVATVYLSPRDYHRFHHPLDARAAAVRRLGGSRYPVNPMGTRLVPRLYVRNERVVVRYCAGNTVLFLVAVGATFVGGIHLTLPLPPPRAPGWMSLDREVSQMEELGRFDLGSTIVLLVPDSLAAPLDIPTGKPVSVGTPLFEIREKSKV